METKEQMHYRYIKELEMQYRAEEDESIKDRIDQQMTMIKKTLRKLEG